MSKLTLKGPFPCIKANSKVDFYRRPIVQIFGLTVRGAYRQNAYCERGVSAECSLLEERIGRMLIVRGAYRQNAYCERGVSAECLL